MLDGRLAGIVDRTFSCAPVTVDTRLVAVVLDAVPIDASERFDPFEPPSPGFVGVGSGAWEPRSELVSVRARAWRRFRAVRSAQGVYANSIRCTPSQTAVPLGTRGLPGSPIRWAEHATCLARGRVVIRIRAMLERAAPWKPAGARYVGARSNVVEAELAVRSERSERPLAYIELARRGSTKLWLSPACS